MTIVLIVLYMLAAITSVFCWTVICKENNVFKKKIPNRGIACDQTQLTPAFLQSEYIKALKDLVDAPNNSTLILPTDQALTPMINLGG